jgi:hypothetical protein
MMVSDMELTPSTLSMEVIARAEDAVYLRLPKELQRDTDGCNCDICKKDPSKAKWDTLVVPTDPKGKYQWTHTVHMPDETVAAFQKYIDKKEGKK